MKEIKLAGLDFGSKSGSSTDPYIIEVHGAEGTGKTRFALTGPGVIGCVPLEQKFYKTAAEVVAETDKQLVMPSTPQAQKALLVSTRKVDAMDEVKAKEFYANHVKLVNNVIFGLLESPDVDTLLIDKWSTYCAWMRFALYGLEGKKVKKIGDSKTFIDLTESNQKLIDTIHDMGQYGKTIILTCAERAEYVNNKETGRMTFEAFKFLGSHVNVGLQLETNKFWKEGSADPKKQWRFRLNVQQAQGASHLCGPDGNPLLEDDMISLANVVMQIEGDEFDLEKWS